MKAVSRVFYAFGRGKDLIGWTKERLKNLDRSRLLPAIHLRLGGVKKNPFCCFGIISAILFLFILLTPQSVWFENESIKINQSLLASIAQPERSFKGSEEFFVGPARKSQKESPQFMLIGGSALFAITPPVTITPQVLGALIDGSEIEDTSKTVTEYIVKEGDALGSIAEKFNISLNTLLWANNLTKNSKVQPGQKLVILPVSGVLHYVKAGDTVSEIAKKYKADRNEVVAFNDLAFQGDVFIGDILIIPNGVMPQAIKPAPVILAPLASSYLICPISSPCRITQGLHFYNAIDFSHGNCGEPIFAAAAGTVLTVRLTDSVSRSAYGGAGNHITILHSNGAVTFYGHVLASFVKTGDIVSQGDKIALMGGQPGTPGAGRSTGCHVHFAVIGASNPFAK